MLRQAGQPHTGGGSALGSASKRRISGVRTCIAKTTIFRHVGGQDGLVLAALVAKLERRWRIDPFLEASTITEVRTVGDLCRVYREFINAA